MALNLTQGVRLKVLFLVQRSKHNPHMMAVPIAKPNTTKKEKLGEIAKYIGHQSVGRVALLQRLEQK